MHARRIYKFGPFSVDATAKVLLRGGEPVHLSRKGVETLIVLLESPGRVVPKDELMAAVWPDRVVDEANLAQNIAVARRTLAVEPGNPGYIETFSGRGYRIVGPVSAGEEEAPAPAEETPSGGRSGLARRTWPAWAALLIALAAVGIWLGRARWMRTAEQEFHRVPITRFAGKEFQPAVSPDGTKVAFLWEQGPLKPARVWVQNMGESVPHQISRGAGQHSSPAWSPDGQSLAYLRFGEVSAEVLVAPVGGGDERVVAHLFPTRFGLSNRHVDWSPDGRLLAVNDSVSASEPLGIFLVWMATGEKKRLTEPEASAVGDVDPRFSPDGKQVAFTRAFDRVSQELFVVPTEGGSPKQVTADGRRISGHDWTSDGKSLVFGSDRDGEFKLWKVRPDAPDPSQTLRFAGIYGDFPLQLSVARRAPILVYSVLQQDFNVWRLDLKRGSDGFDRWTRVIASPALDASPQYSPAGNKIVFRSDRSGEEQLWVCDSDGSNPVQITQGRERPSVGRWSPDGRSIVFNNARDGRIFIASIGTNGQWTTRETGATGYHPVFSPDGKWIYAGTMNSIIRMPAHGGMPSDIVKTRGISLGTSVDGRFLYFVREPAGTSLWRLDTESEQVSRVLDDLVSYCSSCWAVAQDGIYYLGSKHRPTDQQVVYFHDFATGQDRPVVEYPEPLLPIGSGPFSLSPDGRYLLCVRVDPSDSDVIRVEPFR